MYYYVYPTHHMQAALITLIGVHLVCMCNLILHIRMKIQWYESKIES